jgi:hypothetical protein
MSSVYKYYEEGKESKERYELESPLLERCIEEWCSEEKCKVECGEENSEEKCKGVCSEESEKIERMLKYVCAPSNLDMSNYKISWLFKEYYHEIIIPGDKSFKI